MISSATIDRRSHILSSRKYIYLDEGGGLIIETLRRRSNMASRDVCLPSAPSNGKSARQRG